MHGSHSSSIKILRITTFLVGCTIQEITTIKLAQPYLVGRA